MCVVVMVHVCVPVGESVKVFVNVAVPIYGVLVCVTVNVAVFAGVSVRVNVLVIVFVAGITAVLVAVTVRVFVKVGEAGTKVLVADGTVTAIVGCGDVGLGSFLHADEIITTKLIKTLKSTIKRVYFFI